MNDELLVYLAYLATGALITGVHAHGRYSAQAITEEDRDPSDLLASTNPLALGGPQAYLNGFLCYLAVSELAYFGLALSGTLLQYTLKLVPMVDVAGAVSLESALGEGSLLAPIAAAVLLTTAVRTPPLNEVEAFLRRISHRVAGIPATFHRISDSIDRFQIIELGSPPGTASVQSRTVALASDLAQTTRRVALMRGVDPARADHLSDLILQIYCLSGWAMGADSDRLWTRRSRQLLQPLFHALSPRLDAFDAQRRALLAAPSNAASGDPSEWMALLAVAAKLKDDFLVLQSLLVVNNPDLHADAREPVVARLCREVNASQKGTDLNALVTAGVVSVTVCFFLAFVLYGLADSSRLYLELREFDSPVLLAERVPISISEVLSISFKSQLGFAASHALGYCLLFVGAGTVALSLRSSLLARGRWQAWDGHNGIRPFLTYAQVAALGTLAVIPFYILFNFLSVLLQAPLQLPDLSLQLQALLNDFSRQIPGQLANAWTGAVAAWMACLLTDSKGRLSMNAASVSLLAAAALLLALFGQVATNLTTSFGALSLRDSIGGDPRADLDPVVLLLLTLFDTLQDFVPALMLVVFAWVFSRLSRPRSAPRSQSDQTAAASVQCRG